MQRQRTRADLSNEEIRKSLCCRNHPYWYLISYGRALGYHRVGPTRTYWVARYRTRTGDYYQQRLAIADDFCRSDGETVLTFGEALSRAREWFTSGKIKRNATDTRPLGCMDQLIYCPIGEVYTIGHALNDYVEWKRMAAAKSYFHTTISQINYHILPRLGILPVNDFNTEHMRAFVRDVLETEPKKSKYHKPQRRSIELIDTDALRKRKKTANTLTGILRVALQMAWEEGKVGNERTWKILKPIRSVHRPRLLHLTRPECTQLLTCCQPDLQRLVLAALYTGCRAQELTLMEASHVGRDGYGVYITPVKCYRPRFVFLPDEGMAFFLDLAGSKSPRDLLFTRDDGRPWLRYYSAPFKEAVLRAGLPLEFCFHGLRHTYASQLAQAGAPLQVIADQLGHADIMSVSRNYAHLSPQIRESEVRQRFSVLSRRNDRIAKERKKALEKWRKSLHGGNWRTYAQIT